MKALLEKYTAGLDAIGSERKENVGHAIYLRGNLLETVLVTGTTGRLGSHLLAQLLARPDVVRVYALNRQPLGSAKSLEVRSREAFKLWGLDESLLSDRKLLLLECNLAKSRLGIEHAVYEEVRSTF